MSTFLELCELLRGDVGVGGSIATVTGQSGMHLRLINYIIKANRKIQGRKTNWNFLWAEWTQALSGVVAGELTAPDSLGMFDQTSFWVDAGLPDAFPVTYVDYKEWRDGYRHQFDGADQPAYVFIKPNGKVGIAPSPSSEYTAKNLTADYWRKPVDLINNTQVSLIPEQFHGIIVAQAKMYWAEFTHDTGRYNSAFVESEEIYRDLKAHSLPGYEDDGKSQSSINRVIEVL